MKVFRLSNKRFLPFVHRLILPTGILLLVTFYFLEVQGLEDTRNGVLINPIFWIMVILYPLILWQEWKKFKHQTSETDELKSELEKIEESVDSDEDARMTKKLLAYIIGIGIYLLLVDHIGFVIMTLIFLPTMMWIMGTKSKKILIITPIVVVLIIYFVFIEALGIRFPVWPNL